MALLEAMVAMLVLAIGLLGLLGLHLRTLAAAQDSAHRLQAMRLIEDLSERLQVIPNVVALVSSLHTQGWQTGSTPSAHTPCETTSCTPQALLSHIRLVWLNHVFSSLPLGQAYIFATDATDQVGVMLAWRQHHTPPEAVAALLLSTNTADSATVHCPAHHNCHLQYIHLVAQQ